MKKTDIVVNTGLSKEITFKDFDKLNLKPFAENLLQIIERGVAFPIGDMGEKGSYTVSLNAEFGNGKTTFLKMFEHFINNEKSDYDVFFINAWESDFYNEPVIAILSEFVNWLERKPQEKQNPSQNDRHSHLKRESRIYSFTCN